MTLTVIFNLQTNTCSKSTTKTTEQYPWRFFSCFYGKLWTCVCPCPVNKYMLKVNNWNTRKKVLNMFNFNKTPERGHWRRSGVFIVKLEHISYLFLKFLFWLQAGKCLLHSVLPTLKILTLHPGDFIFDFIFILSNLYHIL